MRSTLVISCFLCFFIGRSQSLTVEIPIEYETEGEEGLFLSKDTIGFIQVATERGIYAHHGATERFTATETPPSALLFSKHGTWTGLIDGSVSNKFGKTEKRIAVADSSAISALMEFQDRLFIGTEGEGLYALDIHTDSLRRIALTDPFVYDLAIWAERLYIATDRGIEVYDPANDQLNQKLNETITTELCTSPAGLVAQVYGMGLIRYSSDGRSEGIPFDRDVKKILSKGKTLYFLADDGVYEKTENGKALKIFASSSILDMVALDEGGLAILHRDGKLNFLDLRFSIAHKTDGTTITALAKNQSHLFIGKSGTITAVSLSETGKQTSFELPLASDVVNLISGKNHLYAGTFDQGIFKIDLNSGSIRNFSEQDGLLDNSVLGMALTDDTLWFSTLSGLAYITSDEKIDYLSGVNSTYIYDLHASENELWIGTDGNGLLKRKGGKIVSAFSDAELQKSTVYRISEDGEGTLRCITKDRGIYERNPASGEFTKMEMEVGYAGYTAFGCGPGNSALVVDEGKLILQKNGRTAVYDDESGFGSLSDAFLNTFTAPADNEVFFASGNVVYRYRSEDDLPQIEAALVSISSDFESIGFDNPEIDYDANNLIFTLGSPWCRDAENIEFRYRLSGLEDEFRTTKNTELVYPHLPYGEYRLEATAGYKGIFYGAPKRLMTFTILRPLYLEPWVVASAIILLTLLIYLIIRVRVANINRLRTAERKMVESELAVLRTQVNPHFLFNSFNTLMSIIEPHSKAGAEYLEKLSDFYRHILEEHKSQVISVKEELKILEEYIFLQKKRFGEAFEIEIRLSEKAKASLIPALTLQLLAENALKHNMATRSLPLKITIEEDEYLVFSNPIRKKRKEEEGTGMGLENIRSRYEALFQKKIEIEKDGEHFTVKLPKINSDDAHPDS